jgi:outer membrane immunogenic protein
MNRRLLVAVGSAALAAVPGYAAAADLGPEPVYASPGYSWTGFYIGGNVGGVWGDADLHGQEKQTPGFAVDNAAVSAAASRDLDLDGFIGGGQVGFNLQSGSFVWGLEVDFQGLDAEDSNRKTYAFPSTPTKFFTINQSAEMNWLVTVRPRLGYAFGRSLIYATGGLAIGDVDFAANNLFIPPNVERARISETNAGWTIGGGWEQGVGDRLSIKIEYLHVDLGDTDVKSGVFIPPPPPGFTNTFKHSVEITEDIVRAGINYRFGWSG